MTLYDFKCKGCCGYFEDMFVLLADMEKAVCPSCDGPLQTIIRGVPVIGPMPSKPLVVKHIGRSFESAGEWRDYQRDNPDCQVLSSDSKQWRDHRDSVKEKVEVTSRKMGYRDYAHRSAHRKEEKLKKAGKLDKKIMIH